MKHIRSGLYHLANNGAAENDWFKLVLGGIPSIPQYHYSYRLTCACVNGIVIVYGSINRRHAGGGVVNMCGILRHHITVSS